jgi:2-oxoglutarate dehydrogenase E2 component (dihydrolipoamide succinyltransferase)
VEPPAPVAVVEPPAASGPKSSPLVKKLARDRGLELDAVAPSGLGGRVTRRDVIVTSPPPPPPPPPPPAPAPAGPGLHEATTALPFSNLRRRIAEHMVRSKATSPHVYTSVLVDYERIARVRDEVADEWRRAEGFGLSYLPFVMRAIVSAIAQYPHVNASVDGDSLVVRGAVGLAVAVDLDFEGLVAPVIRGADGKVLRQLARETHELAGRARGGSLGADDLAGGTFTVTNPGGSGSVQSFPIINQPQVAIVSVDAVRAVPAVIEADGEDVVAIRRSGLLTLAWDHRAFDGAYAAAFLGALKDRLEQHDWVAELD